MKALSSMSFLFLKMNGHTADFVKIQKSRRKKNCKWVTTDELRKQSYL